MTRSSLLLSLISVLTLSRIALATDRLICKIPRNFTVDLIDDERANFYGSQLKILFNKDSLVVTSDQGLNTVNIQAIDNVVVKFEGYLVMNNVVKHFATEPEKISQIYVDRISGIAQRVLLNSENFATDRCRLVLLPIEMERPNVDQAIANGIRRFAESCLELEICPRIDQIPHQTDSEGPSSLSGYLDPLLIEKETRKSPDPQGCEKKGDADAVRLAINKLVDVGLSEVVAHILKKYDGPIILPNIAQVFHLGSGIFKTTGFFEAFNGTFRDLATIRRVVDATISHDGMKYMASCGFGLTIADLKYSYYELKYGPFKVTGRMSGKVDGAALEAGVAVNYNCKPCVLSVEYLKVTEFGRMAVELTGLGPLNSIAEKLINWITRMWRSDIIRTIETEMRAAIESQLSTLDCERFRP